MDGLLLMAIMAADTLLTVVFILFLLKGSRYEQMLQPLTSPVKDLFVVGFVALDLIHFNYHSKYAKRMTRNTAIVYGEKYGEYYFRVNMAQKVSMAWFTLIIGLFVTVLLEMPVLVILAVAAAGAIAYYYETTIMDEINARKDAISVEYPEIVSKLALLVNAGMITREAWAKIAENGEGTIYEEMRRAVLEMQNGTSEMDAYIDFAARCNSEQVTKFISSLAQNLSKGNKELVVLLRQFADEAWTEKKQRARQKGEEASSKLLLPITLMFAGILVMICVPVFTNISF